MRRKATNGFSMIELVVVLGVVMVMMAFALPNMRTAMDGIRHRNAVVAATSAIQSTRFQAIRFGTTYRLAFNPVAATYQISRIPPGVPGAFVNVGGPLPLGSGTLALNQATTFDFAPNGTVTASVGAMNFQVQHGTGIYQKIRTITVTRVGHVTAQ